MARAVKHLEIDLTSFAAGSSTGTRYVGGPTKFGFNAVFGSSSALSLEYSSDDGTTWVGANTNADSDISKTATGQTDDDYYCVLPKDCQVRITVATATIASGKCWVSEAVAVGA